MFAALVYYTGWSRPARGAWVEIDMAGIAERAATGRAPQGARGLKWEIGHVCIKALSVAPRKGRVG